MKRFVVAAIIIAALLAVAFAIGKFNPKTKTSFSIVGNWQLDSAYAPASATDSVRQLANAIAEVPEASRYTYRFLADSTLQRLSQKDSLTEKYYFSDTVLFIRSDSSFSPHPVTKTSNDRIEISYPADSITLVLKRLP